MRLPNQRYHFVGARRSSHSRYWSVALIVLGLILALVINSLRGFIVIGFLALTSTFGFFQLQAPRSYVELREDHLFLKMPFRQRRFRYEDIQMVDFSTRKFGILLRSYNNTFAWLLKLIGGSAATIPRQADRNMVDVTFKIGRKPLELWLQDGPAFVAELRSRLAALP